MAEDIERTSTAPGFVRNINAIVHRALGVGVPMGPNALITIRGRKSGTERTTPITLIKVGGRRWVQGAWGETNWVLNLRAAGEATVTVGRKREAVKAVELSPDESVAFFRDVLGPYIRRIPFSRWIAGSMLRSPEFLDDPETAARRHPVFELKRTA
ncbi:MAG TPA: nitroreductase family deazaflavin-dependent oxidoreductase [Candidatus Dormibacteraeota bacterium]|nr:nitroreductase family deazaflavin-dependent oxidoreductase [Candidatus Dormibacteraeota bacterium]